MKRINSFVGIAFIALLVVGLMGFSFLFQKNETKYSEILVSVRPGQNNEKLNKLASKYGLKLEKRPFSFKVDNEFTRKHEILKIYKYDIEPEELNDLLEDFMNLKKSNLIQAMEPNYYIKSLVNDPLYSKQWNLKQLNMEEVWKSGTGKGVVVAVIDSGVSSNLADLNKNRFVKGYNFVSKNDNFDDLHGHGSHVAGTIGQDTNNGKGVAGIAYNSKIMPLRVLNDRGSGSTLDIAEAIVYAADNGANIINMSLGGGGFSQVLKDACDYAAKKGVIVIAAAGNENRNVSSYPARYSSVISVAAADPNYQRAPYSNYGEGVDVIAPGGSTGKLLTNGVLQNGPTFLKDRIDEYENDRNDLYFYFQGTSMASPHVAGIAAILYEKGVKKPEDMRNLLISSSTRKIENLPFVNPQGALARISQPVEKHPKAPVEEGGPVRFNSGAVTTSPLTSIFTILIAVGMLIFFDKKRKKVHAIENVMRSQTIFGLILGANGLALVGFFLQDLFPFILLPERFVGILFNSILDYDRVLFFLTKPSPFWHNFLIPVIFMILLNFKDENKRCFSVGLLMGFAAKMMGEALFIREVALLPEGFVSMLFLGINSLIAFTLPFVLVKK